MIHNGDCLEIMRGMDDNSIDTIITDPPYGLEFMGVAWDTMRPEGKERTRNEWGDFGSREHARKPSERGKIQRNKNVALYEFSIKWAAEALRVAKPGSMLMAFGGTRTYHRLACALEDAGWEIRDCVMWVYGSGFPKSHNISKSIDKRPNAVKLYGFVRKLNDTRLQLGYSITDVNKYFGFATTGSGMAAHWFTHPTQPTVPSRDQYEQLREWWGFDGLDDLYDEAEREVIGKHKAPAKEIYKGGELSKDVDITIPSTPEAQTWDGYGTALKPAWEPIVLAMKPLDGTFAQNALKWGVAGLWIDGGRVGTADKPTGSGNRESWRDMEGRTDLQEHGKNITPPQGRWPANLIHDGSEEVVAEFPDTKSGKMKGGTRRAAQDKPGSVCYGKYGGDATAIDTPGDSGSAARFFYCAKASKAERNKGCEGMEPKDIGHNRFDKCAECGGYIFQNQDRKSACKCENPVRQNNIVKGNCHPTVKPISLMRYLCRLTRMPEGGIVLDPFMGSGSTGIACKLEGRDFIGIEQNPEYCEIARNRIEAWEIEKEVEDNQGEFAFKEEHER